MANGINFDSLDATLGAYCRENGEMLMKQAFLGNETAQHVTVYPEVKDQLPLLTAQMNTVVQPGNPTAWNPTADAFSLKPKILQVKPWKVDLDIIPQQLEAKYYAKVARTQPGSDPYMLDNSFEAFIMGEVIKRVQDDLERIIWHGDTTGSAPLSVADGFFKLITAEVTATNLTESDTDIVDTANAVQSLENMWTGLDDRLKIAGAKMYMSHTIFNAYQTNYRATHGDVAHNGQFQKRFLELSGGLCELVPLRAMAGSNRVVLDPVGILAIGTDLVSDATTIRVEREKRTLNVMLDGKIGTQLSEYNIASVPHLAVSEITDTP